MAIIKTANDSRLWRMVGTPIYCGWEYRIIQPL